MKFASLSMALLVAVIGTAADEPQADRPGIGLKWEEDGTASAQLEKCSLEKVLQSLSEQGRWQIFVEPDLRLQVTTRFKNLTHSKALRRLLSDVNFAIIPSPKASSRLLVYKTSSEKAVVRIVPTKRLAIHKKVRIKPGKIPNELVVTLEPGSEIDIEALAAELGAKIVGKIDGLDVYRLRFENEQQAGKAEALLEKNEGVASIDSNYSITRPDTLTPVELAAPTLNLRPSSADEDGIVIGLVDSSVQREGSQVSDFLLQEIPMAGAPADSSDQVNHGTSMAETILRGLSASLDGEQETSVKILPIDVYGQSESTSTFEVALGVQAAIEAGADIISLSLGSDEQNDLMRAVIQSGASSGVLFLAAAGNEPTGQPVYPAAQSEVIGVTALNRSGRSVANYANSGNFVEAAAPGAGVTVFNNQTFYGTGTSFSTAYLAGVAAGIASTKGLPMAEVRRMITTEMKPPGTGP